MLFALPQIEAEVRLLIIGDFTNYSRLAIQSSDMCIYFYNYSSVICMRFIY